MRSWLQRLWIAADDRATARTGWVAILLALSAVALFSPALSYDFVNYDDDLYVYDNPAVLQGVSASGLVYAAKSQDVGTWAPLTWLSYELDTTLLGARASSYHLTNILLHSAAGALLFLALQRMTGMLWSSAVVAALFLFHPLRVESVVWIAERKDVLCAFFWSLGLLAYSSYVREPRPMRWGILFLCFIAGLLSKMTMATFPFVLLLLDFWPLGRFKAEPRNLFQQVWPLVREKIAFFALAGLAVWMNARALHSVKTMAPVGHGLWSNLLRVPENYWFYIAKVSWPQGLSVLHPVEPLKTSVCIGGSLLLLGLSVMALRKLRTCPCLTVGWLWFLGVLVPVIGLVRFGSFVVADRYTYLPSIGLALAACAWIEARTHRAPIPRCIGALALCGACLLATRAEMPAWRNSIALYSAALQTQPHFMAYNNRGTAYLKAGDLRPALADFNRALELNPEFAMTYANRGSLFTELGRYEEAIRDCTLAIQHDPGFAAAYCNRAIAQLRSGNAASAFSDYDRSLELSPQNAAFYNNRGTAYLNRGDFERALNDFNHAVALNPKFALAYSNRGSVLCDHGRYAEALEDCTRAIQCEPDLAAAYSNRGNARLRSGDLAGALSDYGRSIELSPRDANTYNNRAAAYFQARQLLPAWADLQKCKQLGGRPHPDLMRDLTAAMTAAGLASIPEPSAAQ